MTSEIFNTFQNDSRTSYNNSSNENELDKSKESELKERSSITLDNSKEEKNITKSILKSEENEKNRESLENNKKKYSNIYNPSLFINNFEEIKEFICPLCSNIFEEPTMELCGCHKIFCKNCIIEYLCKNDNKCPFSKKVIKIEPQPVPVIFSTISFFEIKCRNYEYGCNWKGKCGKYKEHLIKYCLKEYKKCINNGCNELMMRENMNKHLKECKYRLILCKLCKSKIRYIDRKKHEKICNNQNDSSCPKGCGEDIMINKSLFPNNNNLIECPFGSFGCKEKLSKEDMEKHMLNDVNKHLILFAQRIIKNEEEIQNLIKLYENTKIFNNDSSNQNVIMENNNINNNCNLSLEKSSLNDKNIDKNNINNKDLQLNETNNSSNLNSFESNELKPLYNDNSIDNENILRITSNSNNKIIVNEEKSHSKLSCSNSSNKSNDSFLKHKRKNSNNNQKEKEYKESSNSLDINNNNYFDNKYISEGKFIIKNNIINAINMNNREHYYIFANEKYNIKKDSQETYKIIIKLNENIRWLAFGVCDKKKVEENNFKFAPSKKVNDEQRNNGSYILSVNSMIWNSNNNLECKKLKSIDPLYLGQAGKEIEFHFMPNKRILQYYIDKQLLISLTNIILFKSDVFTPCIIFLQNCSVEVTFDYPNY